MNDPMETDCGKIKGHNDMSKKLMRDLKTIACGAAIDVKKIVTEQTRFGWECKGKGLLQAL